MTAAAQSLRVGLCQITSTTDPRHNLELLRSGVRQAADGGARVVVFPEASMCRFGVPLGGVAEPLEGPWASAAREIADEHDVMLVAGMFRPADDGRVFNTLLLTGLGEHRGYDKIHLYDAFGFTESRTVAAGTELVTAEVDGVTFGVATCYDVRFPELFRALADRGASMVLVPASWGAGEGKRDQWELLVRARALDSGCWVLGCGQADPRASGEEPDGKAPTGIGYSTVADPFGRMHSQLADAPNVLVLDVDARQAQVATETIAVLANRRL